MLNSVLKHLGVSDLQVFGLAVMKGQLVSAREFRSKCFLVINCGTLRFWETADSE